ncbi:MAG: thioredoxin family protein [Bacteroidia bacterium]
MNKFRFLAFMLVLLGAISSLTAQEFETDFATAQKLSKETGKPILILFSGSDWCRPCIALHNAVFENDAFKEYATDNVILYHADFPRRPENQLPAEIKSINQKLQNKYQIRGLPTTVVLSSDGQILGKMVGNPSGTYEGYMKALKGYLAR